MDFDVLPGPPLPELARTTMARACAAIVRCAGAGGLPPATVPVRASRAGHPILLPQQGSALARQLASGPSVVTVTIPAQAPFAALRLTGMTRPAHHAGPVPGPASHPGSAPQPGSGAYPVSLRSLEFTGAGLARVELCQYEAAAPDPFRHEELAVLRHLEEAHMAELVSCIQAHGIAAAEYVIPRGLDRFGLEFLVLSPSGLAAVRLAFPDGPVTSLREIPASIRAVLTCRCGGGSHA
jgi:hypothetical protein